MKKVRFTGWKKNMNKIKFIHLLNEQTSLSLKESKDIKDKIVNDEIVEIAVDEHKMGILISEALKFGVLAEETL